MKLLRSRVSDLMFLDNTKVTHLYSAVLSILLFMNLIFEYDLVNKRLKNESNK